MSSKLYNLAMQDKPRITIYLRDLRKRRGLTQEALASQLGISRQALIALEQGANAPSLPLVFRIARYFDLSLDDMFGVAPQKRGVSMPQELVPFSPLREMREALDRLMDDNFTMGSSVPARAVPAINVHQTDKAFVIEAHLPGYKEGDVDVEVGDGFVTLSGQIKTDQKNEDKQYLHREWVSQSFSRTLSLPENVDSDHSTADLKDGVLIITLPKVEPAKPKVKKLAVSKK